VFSTYVQEKRQKSRFFNKVNLNLQPNEKQGGNFIPRFENQKENTMPGNIVNFQHKQAHDLIVEYQRVMQIESSQQRLEAMQSWQQKASQYGAKVELKRVG
tara:strand:+ start:800 stop:1102 length:303 start_codon:yes stop_codon:yes gene_type:complete